MITWPDRIENYCWILVGPVQMWRFTVTCFLPVSLLQLQFNRPSPLSTPHLHQVKRRHWVLKIMTRPRSSADMLSVHSSMTIYQQQWRISRKRLLSCREQGSSRFMSPQKQHCIACCEDPCAYWYGTFKMPGKSDNESRGEGSEFLDMLFAD